MKLNVYKDPLTMEEHIDIYCKGETKRIKEIIDYIAVGPKEVFGKLDNSTIKLSLPAILYIESVDNRCFAYTEEVVYELQYKLREFSELFQSDGFIRINKSTIVNIYKIERIKNDFEMRVLLQLTNGETLIINRSYKKQFRQYLNSIKKQLLEAHNEIN